MTAAARAVLSERYAAETCSAVLCGSTVRPLARDDPRGYSVRERRLVVRCNSTEGCRWQGVLVVELVDIPAKDRTFRRAS